MGHNEVIIMGSVSSLLVVSALAAADGQALPVQPHQSAEPASITFVSEDQTLVGIAYGIDAIDSQPRAFGQRLSANVTAGLKTVWYSCPNDPQMKEGSRITFNFVGGHHYELACRPGKDAVIRPSDEC
ncbi:hypothetical protein [Lysobacter sp. CFH 32150]|uniref:hypothetical protein n=1 Tax=Lysobacter sp. CFH 32150 TaxID=2927128 RepID=UPI001FA782FD|nr:hypothetical protein [Lysobacter sp. CFH 32150]MCI4568506.1 hypothetical protein [Lysobacter sp. CFH 32150]